MDWYVLSERTNRAATSTLSTSWQVAAGTQAVSRVL
jgi:alkaline phosphatase D